MSINRKDRSAALGRATQRKSPPFGWGCRALALVLAAALVSSTLPAVGLAQQAAQPAGQPSSGDLERARALFEQGSEAYSDGRYEAAAEAFQASYAIAGAPELLYNIGQSYERAGLLPQALEALQRYLAAAPNAADAPAVRERVAIIQRNFRQSQLRIVVTPRGARIRVDGRDVGRAPLDALTVTPGEHLVEIEADGHRRYRTTFQVALARLHRIEADLAPIEEDGTGEIERSINWTGPIASWVLAGAFLGGGIVLGVHASGLADDATFRDDSTADDARLFSYFSDAAFVVAFGFAALGTILALTAEPEEEGTGVTLRASRRLRPRTTARAPEVSFGLGGLSVRGSF